MKIKHSLGIAPLLVFVVFSTNLEGQRSKPVLNSHIEWVGGALKEMQGIKAGMTRNDLLKVFRSDGGLNSGRTFVYRNCPYFKVEVEFQHDRIMSISTPYLANPRLD